MRKWKERVYSMEQESFDGSMVRRVTDLTIFSKSPWCAVMDLVYYFLSFFDQSVVSWTAYSLSCTSETHKHIYFWKLLIILKVLNLILSARQALE